MLFIQVKPKHTRMHLKSENLEGKQPNNGMNLVDVSRTLLRIVARLPKTQYSESVSTEKHERCARVRQHSNTPDPASASDTSQG